MNQSIIVLDEPLKGIEVSKSQQIKAIFEPMANMLSQFEASYDTLIGITEETGVTEEIIKQAKRLRLDIGQVRIKTEKLRIAQKQEYLIAGKAIDGVSNILKWAVTDKENKLKEIENYFIVKEQERLKKLQVSRANQISLYLEDAQTRRLSDMEDDVWEAYFNSKKKEYEDRLEAEKQAKLEKELRDIQEALRWERADIIKPYYNFFNDENIDLGKITNDEFEIILHNLKTKKSEYDKEQSKTKEENERLKKEIARKEKERKVEKEKNEVKLKNERDANKLIVKAEKVKQDRLEEELKTKEDAELKEKQDKEIAIQAELNKDDSDKIKDLMNDLVLLKTKYSFKSDGNKVLHSRVNCLIDSIIEIF